MANKSDLDTHLGNIFASEHGIGISVFKLIDTTRQPQLPAPVLLKSLLVVPGPKPQPLSRLAHAS
jgi:hypothetical protein